MLFVNNIFYSIQGESSFAGFPCLFVRLAGCNIKCSYCDTVEALNISNSKPMEIDQIIAGLNFLSKNIRLVEITGGEPLIQSESIGLIKNLINLGFKVLLETNGTISLKEVPSNVIKIVDVKCPSSGFQNHNLPENLQYIDEKDEIKFVIGSWKDYIYSKNFIRENKLKTLNIIFSPVYNKISYSELAEKILKDEIAVRLGVQIHKIAGLQ